MTPRGLDFKKPDTERVFLAGLGGLLLSSSALRFFHSTELTETGRMVSQA